MEEIKVHKTSTAKFLRYFGGMIGIVERGTPVEVYRHKQQLYKITPYQPGDNSIDPGMVRQITVSDMVSNYGQFVSDVLTAPAGTVFMLTRYGRKLAWIQAAEAVTTTTEGGGKGE